METSPHSPETNLEQHARNALSESEITSLRAAQRETYSKLYAEHSAEEAAAVEALVNDEMDKIVAGFLGDHRLAPDSPHYDEYHAAIRGLSYDNMSDTSWRYGEWQDGEHTKLGPTGHDVLLSKQTELFGAPTVDTITTPEPEPAPVDTADTKVDSADTTDTARPENPALIEARENNETLKSAREKLDGLRGSLAAITAKQLGKPVTLSGKYLDAHEAYNEALVYVGKLEETVLSQAKADRTDDEKNADTISYIFDEQKKLREATQELFANTKVSKLNTWFNRGGRMKRIAKGIAVGLPMGVAGAVFAPAGAAAAVLVVGAAGTRFIRNYARNDNERGIATTDESIKEQKFVEVTDDEDRTIENAVKYAGLGFHKEKSAEQRKRANSIMWGLGGVAVGSAVSQLLTEAAQAGVFDGAIDWAKDRLPSFGNKEVGATPPKGPSTGGGHVPTEPGTGDHVDKPDTVVDKDLTANQLFDGNKGSTEFTTEGLKDFNKWIEGHHVASGESVWSLSEGYLQQEGVAKPSVYQVDAVKDSVLKEFQAKDIVNGRGWLSKGDIIKLK